MLNRKYFPFERNSYYFGKLLTARDFEAEQRYFNDKRRLVNRLTGANGIVAGLGVIMADDASVILQAGCAFDASGREIVVPETKVVKLSTIEGFSQLSTNCACLGIRYDEQPADEVYSAMSDENGGVHHNKIREQYRLTLLDKSLVARVPREIDEYLTRLVIYADSDVEVVQMTPRYLPRGCAMRVAVQISRLCEGAGEYSFAYRLETPGFKGESGQSSQEVALNGVKLSRGESKTLELTLNPEPYLWGGSASLSVADFAIRRGEESFSLNRRLEVSVKPVDAQADDYYLSSCYARAMDKTLSESYDERLWLAEIWLIRQNQAAIIDRVAPPPFVQYCYNAQQLMTLRRLEAFYPVPGTATAAAAQTGETGQTVLTEQADAGRSSCGVFNLPLGLGYGPKESIFSEEIMHGLGKGPVYVDVGVEFITADKNAASRSEIILGDISIFGQDDHPADQERAYNLSTAVKVLPERGTFVVGVRLDDASGILSLRIRWFAFKLGEIDRQLKPTQEGDRMILVNPDTIVLPPKGTAHISPVFINMPNEPCNYRVLEPEGGTVDQNGLYTAPSKEGAYEIRIEVANDPAVYTHVFAIVTQKKKD